ncbi:MAG TPA: glycosyltransferase family 2 protein [Mycobacteriales bacterium]|nr:glycosyltransferase family 2 protein [Mycobacteriales bacterium]HWC34260.1 glycosyltransferase family 2 protein [Mycobacteriales bacterium]
MAGSGAAIEPLVDVAIVTWNTRETTLTALRALLASEPPGTLAVHVRDNGSSDGTAAAVRAAFPEVTVDSGEANLGFAGGVNTILGAVRSPWVLLLNPDAWPEPGAISRLVACAARHPRAAAVAPKLLRPDDRLEASAWPFPSLRVTFASALRRDRAIWPHDAERRVDWAVGAALLIRREALAEIGGLDESLFMYAEDLEWCWRAHDRGWEVWFTPDAVVRHIGNVSGAQQYGERQPAAWIANSVAVYRRRRGAIATGAWRFANAASAAIHARRARRSGDAAAADQLRQQKDAWLHPTAGADGATA